MSEELPRGITKWVTFTIFFTVVPVGFDQTGHAPLGYIISIVLSLLVLVAGAAMYALAKAVTETNPLPFWVPVCYGLASVAVSFTTVWVSER